MVRVFAAALLCVFSIDAQPARELRLREDIRGGAVASDTLFTWGKRLRKWMLPSLRTEILASGDFGEGGCLVDFNQDGRLDVVLQEGAGLGVLVWFEAPAWKRHVLDREIEMHDCLAAELLGHRGFLMIHRYSQLRFYEPAGVRDIYSIYTASRQGGLALVDVDGDGKTDILSGNYWLRSPQSFDLPWRLFAINTISEQENSALFRLAWNGALVLSQGELKPARLLRFRTAATPAEQWPASSLADDLAFPHGLLLRENEILVGENDGPRSRLLSFSESGARQVLQCGIATHTILAAPGGFVTLAPRAVYFWRR